MASSPKETVDVGTKGWLHLMQATIINATTLTQNFLIHTVAHL